MSALALLFGVAVGPLFATADHWGLIAGALVFYLAFLSDCARDFGDFVPLRIGRRRMLLVSDPAAIEEVLITKSRDFFKHWGLKQTSTLLGNGLLNSEGEFWLRQRRLAQPAFHRDRIQQYGQDMIDHTRRMLEAMHHGCVCLATQTGASPEVAGDAAVYVNPYSIEDVTCGLKRVANLPESERQGLTNRARQQAAHRVLLRHQEIADKGQYPVRLVPLHQFGKLIRKSAARRRERPLANREVG